MGTKYLRMILLSVAIFMTWTGVLRSQELFVPESISSYKRAGIYAEIAREDNSTEMYLLAAEQYEKALKEAVSADDSIDILIRSSYVRCRAGDMKNLSASLQKAINLSASSFGTGSREFAETILDAADICNMAGDYVKAHQLLKYCRKSIPCIMADRDMHVKYLKISAENDFQSGKNLKAVREAARKSRIAGKSSGKSGAEYVNSLLDVSGYAFREDTKPGTAIRYHRKASGYSSVVLERFGKLSEAGRKRFWRGSSNYYETTLALSKIYGSLGKEAYDAVLFTKGILLNTSASFSDFVRQSNDSVVLHDYNTMCTLMAGVAPDYAIDSLDQKIIRRLHDLGLDFTDRNALTSWKDVRQAMGKDDLAVEFFGSSAEGFGAVILRKDWNRPRTVALKENAGNAKVPLYWRDSLGIPRRKEAAAKTAGSVTAGELSMQEWKISKAIWNRKIRKHFPRTQDGRVYFSPSGELNLAGIEYLPAYRPDKDSVSNAETFADCYKMYRLSSTRQLVDDRRQKPGTPVKAGIYGGIDYNAQTGRILNGIEKIRDGESIMIDTEYERNIGIRTAAYAGKLQPLPGSVQEVHTIGNILDGTFTGTDLLTGRYATEDAFKLLAGHEDIIHIATHGFFLQTSDAISHPYYLKASKQHPQFLSDPLNRSGIHFAGSQKVWSGYHASPGREDGVLTSKEISLMDLRRTGIVVLSACNTAAGDVGKDGIYGLQRAFKKAGAHAMVLSLWKVDDDATQYMMRCFYQNLFLLGMSMHEAFSSAIRILKETPEYSSPYYWASFVLLDPNTDEPAI